MTAVETRVPGLWALILAGFGAAHAASAGDLAPQGFVDTYHAVRLHCPGDFLSSRTRVRLEGWIYGGEASLFASLNAVQNSVVEGSSGIELREAFLDYQAGNWDLRFGRQIIVWGKADGLPITDIISPLNYTEFLARDFDDLRIPVDALRIRILGQIVTLEFLWIPGFTPAVLPLPGSPWFTSLELPGDAIVQFQETKVPDFELRNSEVAGKISVFGPGFDVALSAFRTWADLPTLHRSVIAEDDSTAICFYPEHRRLSVIGAEASIPKGAFVIRAEGALYLGSHFEPADIYSESVYKRNSLNMMLGLDWSPGRDWALTGQIADTYILGYDERIADRKHQSIATLRFGKELLGQTLDLSAMSYFGLTCGDGFTRISADYALTDDLHIVGGCDFFYGGEGAMGQYDNNDEIWLKAKFSF